MSAKAICFLLGAERYAVPIEQVKETIVLRPITRVFLTPPFVAGLINLRGDIVPVLDLAVLLGLDASLPGDDTRVVIARHGGKTVGLLVDRLLDGRSLDPARLEPPPPTLSADAAELTTGIATLDDGAPLTLLDVGRLLASERLRPFQRPS